MQKGKLLAVLVTILCLLVILLTGELEARENLTISAVMEVQGQEETITCWQSSWDTAYVFLPGCVQLDQVRLKVAEDSVFWIDGQPVVDGMTCEGFQLDKLYPLEISKKTGLYANKIVFMQSTGVHTLFVDVHSGNMKYLNQDKKHKETGWARMYDLQGGLCYAGQLDSVSGRGQSSWEREKKSYNIRLAQAADLLGMGTAENWVLQANSVDNSNLRNKIVFGFSDAAGLPYSPDSQWVDLYFNGEYAGLYLLCERIEVHPERVAIAEKGSALISKDWEWRFEAQGDPYVLTQNNVALGIRYLSMEEETLAALLQSVENAILAEDGIDKVTGKHWTELIDLESWVKKYLVEEIFANRDGQALSQYYYLDGGQPDGLLRAGPVWDYDLTMEGAPNLYYINRDRVYGSSWQPALFKKPEFYACLREQYAAVFRPLLQELLDTQIHDYIRQIEKAAYMNSWRWGTADSLTQAENIITYMRARVEFLDRLWIDGIDYVTVQTIGHDGSNRVYVVETGGMLPELPETDGTYWCYEGGKEPVDRTLPVTENLSLYQRVDSGPDAASSETEEEQTEEQEDTAIPFRQWAPAAVLLIMLAAVMLVEVFRTRQSIRETRKHEQVSADFTGPKS